MAQKLDFSLPEEAEKKAAKLQQKQLQSERAASSSRSSATFFSFLAFLLAALLVVLHFTDRGGADAGRVGGSGAASGGAEDTEKDLALKLERRGLDLAAARVWEDHLHTTAPGTRDRANLLFKIAELYRKAGQDEEAVEFYYRAELEGKGELSEEVQFEINRGVQASFERMGRFTALEDELTDRTRVRKNTPDPSADDPVLAEIGKKKITARDLDLALEQMVDLQVQSAAASVPPEQRMAFKEQMLSQMRSPQMKAQLLEELVNRELLYRLAKQSKIEQDDEVSALVEETVRQIISSRALEAEVGKRVQLTQVDFETYYKANEDKYREPERVELRLIKSESEEEAQRVLEELGRGAVFEEVATRFSVDEGTKNDGGKLPSPLSWEELQGRYGFEESVLQGLFTATPGTRLESPAATASGVYVLKVENRIPERTKSFSEVQSEVVQELSGRKQQEAVQQVIQELRDRERVVIYSARLPKEEEPTEVDGSGGGSSGPPSSNGGGGAGDSSAVPPDDER